MCNFIKNSKLIKKLESETSDKKSDMQNLVFNCAKNLGYVKLEKGKVLFRIGDIGDKFYFILKGKISVLKLKEFLGLLQSEKNDNV
jgi:CRP-like cAMP-binding protein